MPIHTPGKPFRSNNILSRKKGKREVTATLSLTAMVDMFTVLVIFLLQNYSATGEVIFIPKEVTLPKAGTTKELKPAIVVTVSSKEILIDKTSIIPFDTVKAQEEWLIEPLRKELVNAIARSQAEYNAKIGEKLRNAVGAARGEKEIDTQDWNKITVQADKGIDFLTIKKVMYTVTEAGAGEINFAVTKQRDQN